jgi:branched-chain amino acid transport system ATP-binding protein/nonpolar-amino-acid-transporting ATPase
MLVVEGLSAGYGEVNVLSEVSIEVGHNESVAIVGANGAGKSTLVSAICGLIPTRQGRIMKDGHAIHTLPAHRRAGIGIAVVLENRHLFGELSVRQNLELARNSGRVRKRAHIEFEIQDVLQLFPFMNERLDSAVDLLSGGEQQMIAIGRALLLKPDLLILDELSTGLAPKVMMDILSVITALRGRGMSLLLIEQNVAVAERGSDRAYVMSLGRVVQHVDRGGWPDFAQSELVTAYLGKH